MTTPERTKNNETPAAYADGELGNVQKFLFGEPIAKLSNDITALTQRFDALERSLKQDISSLSHKIKREKIERLMAIKQASHQSEVAATQLQSLMDDKQSNNDAELVALETKLESAVDELTVTLDLTREDLLTKLIEATNKLQAQKLDKRLMSEMLGTFSKQVDTSELHRELPWLKPKATEA